MRAGILAAALALVLVAAAPAAAVCSPTALESEVMCPTCEGQTLDQSQAPAAQRVKAFIRERSRAGDTCDEIKGALVADFGERILAAPPREGFNLLAWVLPLAGLGAGAVAVALAAWRWSRRREPEPVSVRAAASGNGRVTVDPELERRLDEELARFEP
jgi:cytochrome c-type biogenesis protein CcmH/NrfF